MDSIASMAMNLARHEKEGGSVPRASLLATSAESGSTDNPFNSLITQTTSSPHLKMTSSVQDLTQMDDWCAHGGVLSG
jgi:hypothetical protein